MLEAFSEISEFLGCSCTLAILRNAVKAFSSLMSSVRHCRWASVGTIRAMSRNTQRCRVLPRRGLPSLKPRTNPVSDSSRNNLRSLRMHPSIQNKLNPIVVSIALYAAFVTTPMQHGAWLDSLRNADS